MSVPGYQRRFCLFADMSVIRRIADDVGHRPKSPTCREQTSGTFQLHRKLLYLASASIQRMS